MSNGGDVLFDAPMHPSASSAAKIDPNRNWFTGAARRQKKLEFSVKKADGRLLWGISKMAAVLVQSNLGFTTIVAQALERCGVQSVFTADTVDELEALLIEASACAKAVTVLCHQTHSAAVDSKLDLIHSLAGGKGAPSITILCLKPAEPAVPPSPSSVDHHSSLPSVLEGHSITTSLTLPFKQRELMNALCANHSVLDQYPGDTSVQEMGVWALGMAADVERRVALQRILDRSGGGDSCGLDPAEVREKLSVVAFDCVIIELPLLDPGNLRRRSWWRFVDECEEVTESTGEEMNAVEAGEMLQHVQQDATMPIIVITSNPAAHMAALCDSGASFVIPFPCNEKNLLATIANAAQGKTQNKATRKLSQLFASNQTKKTNRNSRIRTSSHDLTVTSSDGEKKRATSQIYPSRSSSTKGKSKRYSELNSKTPQQELMSQELELAAVQRGNWDAGWVSLISVGGNIAGIGKGATHHVPQDRMTIIDNFNELGHTFLGVFDGHGPLGHHVSSYLREQIPQFLSEVLLQQPAENRDMAQAIKDVCKITADAIEQSDLDLSSSGSTAVFMVVTPTTIYIGNVGDSRAAVICHKPGTCCRPEGLHGAPLTDDHKPENPTEATRIEAAGGMCVQMGPVMRVVQPSCDTDGSIRGLAMTRSFGDLWASQLGVVPSPDVFVYERTDSDRYVVLGSDGLWDVLNEIDVANALFQGERTTQDITKVTQGIVETAAQKWAGMGIPADDTSLVVALL